MSTKSKPASQCQFISARGHRCRMIADKHPSLCPFHAARSKSQSDSVDPEILAADLLGSIEDFSRADVINVFLGNLVRQLARKRIARRDAIALAYIGQLLLNSLPALDRQLEAEKDAAGGEFLIGSLLEAKRSLSPQANTIPNSQAEGVSQSC